MKNILLILSISTAIHVTAQEKTINSETTKSSRFTFGWMYSPEVSYRILAEGKESNSGTQDLIDARNDNERSKFGQSTGVFFGYKLSKILTLEGGLTYSDFGEGQKPIEFQIATPPDIIIATYTRTNHLHVASIPLTLHVNMGKNRLKGFISAGIAPGYMMRYTTYSVFDYSNGDHQTSKSYSANTQKNYSRFILGAHISGGIDYHYTEKATLRIAPVFRMTANNVYTVNPIRANYFNAGIEIGTVYNL